MELTNNSKKDLVAVFCEDDENPHLITDDLFIGTKYKCPLGCSDAHYFRVISNSCKERVA